MIIIYTDGSSRGNPGRGGYGAILIYNSHRKEISGGFRKTTNNRMELMGVIQALKCLKQSDIPIKIYSDSKYVIDTVQKGWLDTWVKKNFLGKKNTDLWKEYYALSRGLNIKFIWVKGHASNELNNRCDVLATSAADGGNLSVDDFMKK